MSGATDRRLIGPHLPLGQGLLKAAERARAIGATAVQVSPTTRRRGAGAESRPRLWRHFATNWLQPG